MASFQAEVTWAAALAIEFRFALESITGWRTLT
jgi:hypothetical protein